MSKELAYEIQRISGPGTPTDEQRAKAKAKADAFIESLRAPGGALEALSELAGFLVVDSPEKGLRIMRMSMNGKDVDALIAPADSKDGFKIIALLANEAVMESVKAEGGHSPDNPALQAASPPFRFLLGTFAERIIGVNLPDAGEGKGCGDPDCEACNPPGKVVH